MSALTSTLILLLRGNAKALVAALAALFAALAATAHDGLTLPEILTATGAFFVALEGVRRIPNTGPKANATEVPIVDDVTEQVAELLDGLVDDPASRISVDPDSIARAVGCCLEIRVDDVLVGREPAEEDQ